MSIAGGLDICRKQITFDYPGTVTGQVRRGQVSPAGREHLRARWGGSTAAMMSRRSSDMPTGGHAFAF